MLDTVYIGVLHSQYRNKEMQHEVWRYSQVEYISTLHSTEWKLHSNSPPL